ncbi:hypothetical protein [Prosthecobacter sp.]|uniref:hypothetical protein n=1 Tax=Prosthecobacter sp. TaxID=1965333 RepID=UPI003783664F
MKQLLLLLLCAMVLAGCSTPKPAYLNDDDVLPVGTSVHFWIDHDKHGWVQSNIYIKMLPREMTGREVRMWAEGVGKRDAGMRWTHYYVIAHVPPGQPIGPVLVSRVYTVGKQPVDISP